MIYPAYHETYRETTILCFMNIYMHSFFIYVDKPAFMILTTIDLYKKRRVNGSTEIVVLIWLCLSSIEKKKYMNGVDMGPIFVSVVSILMTNF